MKKIRLIAVLPILLILSGWNSAPAQLVDGPTPAAPGTYQIIQDVKMREIFTTETMDSLRVVFELLRNDSTEVIHTITPYTKARIPSRQEVESPTFVPLSEYEYIEE